MWCFVFENIGRPPTKFITFIWWYHYGKWETILNSQRILSFPFLIVEEDEALKWLDRPHTPVFFVHSLFFTHLLLPYLKLCLNYFYNCYVVALMVLFFHLFLDYTVFSKYFIVVFHNILHHNVWKSFFFYIVLWFYGSAKHPVLMLLQKCKWILAKSFKPCSTNIFN